MKRLITSESIFIFKDANGESKQLVQKKKSILLSHLYHASRHLKEKKKQRMEYNRELKERHMHLSIHHHNTSSACKKRNKWINNELLLPRS